MKGTEIKGYTKSRRVFIRREGSAVWKELTPDESLKHVRHSPDGFAWGYDGSGPSQLAFAILLELYNAEIAGRYYMAFRTAVLAKLEMTEDFYQKLPLPNLKKTGAQDAED